MFLQLRVSSAPIFFWSFSVFLFIEICDLFLPFSSKYAGFQSQVVYYSFFILYFLFLGAGAFWHRHLECRFPSIQRIKKLSHLFFFLAFVSLLMVLYDRVFLQGVSYDQGIAQARESWREGASGRAGVSSIFSVIGNLLFPLVYMSFFFIYVFFERVARPGLLIFLSVVLVFLFSVITGGRELLLILVAVSMSSCVLRSYLNMPVIPRGLGVKMMYTMLGIFVFAVYIAYSRSQSYTEGLAWYANSLASRLGGSASKSSGISDFTPEILMPVLIYIAHVKWIFLNVIEESMSGGLSTFRQLFLMLDGYTPLPSDMVYFEPPSYTPNWISLIGSIYYDFGVFGFLVFCIFVFFSGSFVYGVLRVRQLNSSFFSLVLINFVVSVLVMAPFAFIFEIVQFIYFLIPLSISFLVSWFDFDRSHT